MVSEQESHSPERTPKANEPPSPGEVGLGARRINIAKFGPIHPGGKSYLEAFSGRDGADAYLAFHPHASATHIGTPYAALCAALEKQGLFKPDGRQARAFVSDLALFFVGAGLAQIHPAFAVVLALGIMRLQYTQHDIWHGQWHPDRRRSELLGNALGLFTGTTAKWWRDRDHDPHHFFCNDFPADPNDFLAIPLRYAIALPGIYLYILWCSVRDGGPIARLVSFAHLAILVLLLGPVAWPIFLLTYAIAWIPFQLVHHPPKYIPARDWVTGQILNTQDVVGSAVLRWLMAGHDRQMEHHLFPRMPRHRLEEAAKATAAFCKAHGLPKAELRYGDALHQFKEAWWSRHISRRAMVS